MAINEEVSIKDSYDALDKSSDYIESLSIDNLIFGLEDNQLKILLIKRGKGLQEDKWALPGGWIKKNENLLDAATRLLTSLTGVKHPYLEQLKTFGKVNRFPNKRIVSVAYYALISASDYELVAGYTASDVAWVNINDIPSLVFDHQEIIDYGINFIQSQVRHRPIGFNLLPEKFTLFQLQELYESLLGIKLDNPNFRRKIMKMNLLTPCNEKQKGVAHRAANLYRFDTKIYQKLTLQGFTFEV